jgi:Meiotically up-regulated gene 113
VDKQHIIDEIKRTAAENGGVPLGRQRFEAETGIRIRDWHGKHWRSWGDALVEAGFQPNQMASAYPEPFLLEKLVTIVRDIRRFPTAVDFQMRARSDPSFPSATVFQRLGTQPVLRQKVAAFCSDRPEFSDVLAILGPVAPEQSSSASAEENEGPFGFVYLMKSGRFYKIGHTNALGRREYELAIQLPEKAAMVHSIKTDDPEGIERYWHERFKDRRANGEWFNLSASDVAAFRRRKFM